MLYRQPQPSSSQTLLMIAYHFAPENVSGTHRSLHFARNLYQAGHQVHVITRALETLKYTDNSLIELFPFSEHITRVAPYLTLGDRYIRLKAAFLRSRTSAAQPSLLTRKAKGLQEFAIKKTLPRKIWDHIAAWDVFPDEHRGWYRAALRAGRIVAAIRNIGAVFASGPPWTAVRVGWQLAKELQKPLICDYRDPWTKNTGCVNNLRYHIAWCQWLSEVWERRILQDARLTLFASPGMMNAARQNLPGGTALRFRTILNGSDVPRREHSAIIEPSRPLVFRHFGALYRGRSLGPLVEGLVSPLSQERIRDAMIKIELIGPPIEESYDIERLCSLPGIQFSHTPTLPFRDAVTLMGEPSILVVTQPAMFNGQIPTKLYDYLCTGNPVVVIAPEESSTWAVAQEFKRCYRMDDQHSSRNIEVLTGLLDRWKAGALGQERSVEDTAALTKNAIGQEFVAAIEEALSADSRGGHEIQRTRSLETLQNDSCESNP